MRAISSFLFSRNKDTRDHCRCSVQASHEKRSRHLGLFCFPFLGRIQYMILRQKENLLPTFSPSCHFFFFFESAAASPASAAAAFFSAPPPPPPLPPVGVGSLPLASALVERAPVFPAFPAPFFIFPFDEFVSAATSAFHDQREKRKRKMMRNSFLFPSI